MRIQTFDFVVVGSGLAGLVAAYHAAQYGRVALISKSKLDTSNSYHAQGGIAVVTDEGDTSEAHACDTIIAGRGLCDHDAVEVLVREGQRCVDELLRLGMQFDKDEKGHLKLGLEGGHLHRRILHAGGDSTGRLMTDFMLRKVLELPGVETFEYTAAVKLVVENQQCYGVQAFDFRTGENVLFKTGATIIATGGVSRLFARTTNPHTATGDGIALAWDAGIKIADMEFIQFHPSALNLEGHDAFLISEAVRGEGAHLLDCNGVRFMTDIHPLGELAPRDVVAAAIYRRMQKTGRSVFLSLRHLDSELIKKRFQSIDKRLSGIGMDMTRDLIPIAPAAHYMVGGIRTDLWGQTSIKGLLACGEVASTGVMGANRLASNSLLECLVYGKRVVEHVRKQSVDLKDFELPEEVKPNVKTDELFLSVKNELADLMNTQVGILRNAEGIKKALLRIEEILNQFADVRGDYNRLKIKNMASVCQLIARSALTREESRGGHIREDFQDEDSALVHHIIQQKGAKISYEPVRLA